MVAALVFIDVARGRTSRDAALHGAAKGLVAPVVTQVRAQIPEPYERLRAILIGTGRELAVAAHIQIHPHAARLHGLAKVAVRRVSAGFLARMAAPVSGQLSGADKAMAAALVPTEKGLFAGVRTPVHTQISGAYERFRTALPEADKGLFASVGTSVHNQIGGSGERAGTVLPKADKGPGAAMGEQVFPHGAVVSEPPGATFPWTDNRFFPGVSTQVDFQRRCCQKLFPAALV